MKVLDRRRRIRRLDHRRPTGDKGRRGDRWADLNEPDVAAAAVVGVDAVSDQAAMVGVGVDFADAAGYMRDNDLATAVLLGSDWSFVVSGVVDLTGRSRPARRFARTQLESVAGVSPKTSS